MIFVANCQEAISFGSGFVISPERATAMLLGLGGGDKAYFDVAIEPIIRDFVEYYRSIDFISRHEDLAVEFVNPSDFRQIQIGHESEVVYYTPGQSQFEAENCASEQTTSKFSAKIASKEAFFSSGFPTLPWRVAKEADDLDECISFFQASGVQEVVAKENVNECGNGNYFISSTADSDYVKTQTKSFPLLIEPMLSSAWEFVNQQYLCTGEGACYLGSSGQVILTVSDDEVERRIFSGSVAMSTELNHKTSKISHKVAKVIQREGYRGFVGIDLAILSDKVYVVEANCRSNYATYLFLRQKFCSDVNRFTYWAMHEIVLNKHVGNFSSLLVDYAKEGILYKKGQPSGVIVTAFQKSSVQILILAPNKCVSAELLLAAFESS